MLDRTMAVILAALILLAFSTHATEAPYHRNVSDIELEESIKGCTYNKGPTSYVNGSSKQSDCCCKAPTTVVTTATTTTSTPTAAPTASGTTPRIKYILDGKPVYEDGHKGPPGPKGEAETVTPLPDKPEAPKVAVNTQDLKLAIEQLGTSAWRDAQTQLISAGKAAIPLLIDGLKKSDAAYNLGGHTKFDAGRATRTRTIGEVCAELLTDIVANHSNYKGDLPALDQAAWRDWWGKNEASLTIGSPGN